MNTNTDDYIPKLGVLEREVALAAAAVKELAQTTKSGFLGADKELDRLRLEFDKRLDRAYNKAESIGRPNYAAVSAAFVILTVFLGYFVNSQTGPIAETIKAERDARMEADRISASERLTNTQAVATLRSSVVSSTPEERVHFMDRINTIDKKITALETWDEARKLWKDHGDDR